MDAGTPVADFLERAQTALDDMEVLLESGSPFSIINRAYYAAFYAASALLASAGLHARSHKAVIELLHREFVARGLLSREAVRDYQRLHELRLAGDYAPFERLNADRAQEASSIARQFVALVMSTIE